MNFNDLWDFIEDRIIGRLIEADEQAGSRILSAVIQFLVALIIFWATPILWGTWLEEKFDEE